VELVTDYLEGVLTDTEQLAVTQHLQACPKCRTYVEQISATIAVARGLHEHGHGVPDCQALVRAFRTLDVGD